MISVTNLTKSYGGQILFDKISFKVNRRERVGLVGRNGHGKTTLFRILSGEEEPDSGTIHMPRAYRIGCVQQNVVFSKTTVLEEGLKGLPEAEKDQSWKVEKILSGLGFSQTDLKSPPDAFSGGFQVRLNLAKTLVSQPDLLLLDEPTNYLDIASIRWIERFLLDWPGELMIITHDRSFMDKVVTHTLGVHRKKIRKISGNTEKLYAQIAQEEEIHEKTRVNDERKRKELEEFIRRFRAKARLANLVQSRIKTLEKQKRKEKLEKIRTLDFSFRNTPFRGKYMLTARKLSFSYDPQTPLIHDFDLAVRAGDRMCVVGPNGKGKTTLLKLLAGVLESNSGEVVYNPGVQKGFFEQTNVAVLNTNRTVEEEILFSHGDVDRQLARNICGAMMFEGDDALKKIAVLSGGEKSRVMLGRILASPLNLLLLDEPSNHLDMYACDALLAAIDSFDGAVVMVTHNEMFLHALAERLVVFQNGGIEVFEGSYQDFLERGGWGDDEKNVRHLPANAVKTYPESRENMRFSKRELRRRRSEIIAERSRVLGPIGKRIADIENEIESREEKMAELGRAMEGASQANDGDEIARLSQAASAHQPMIESLFAELEALTEDLEEKQAAFEESLQALESGGAS